MAVYPISSVVSSVVCIETNCEGRLDSLAGNQATPSCSTTSPLILKPHTVNKVAYTYDVVWRSSSLPYASRWDAYLRILNPSIHLLSLLNSFFTVLFLVFLCFSILLKSVNRDISKYAAIDLGEDAQEDSAWRKIYGEVFRPCRKRNLLAALVGSGCQLGVMLSTTLFFAILGFLSPSNRGSMTTMVVVAWMLDGIVAGYISSRVYASVRPIFPLIAFMLLMVMRQLRGEEWTKNVAFTSLLFPSFLFGVISLLNFLLIGAGASGALPFGTILATLLLFLFVNIPLTLLGSWIGAKKGVRHPSPAFSTHVLTIPMANRQSRTRHESIRSLVKFLRVPGISKRSPPPSSPGSFPLAQRSSSRITFFKASSERERISLLDSWR